MNSEHVVFSITCHYLVLAFSFLSPMHDFNKAQADFDCTHQLTSQCLEIQLPIITCFYCLPRLNLLPLGIYCIFRSAAKQKKGGWQN